MNFKNQQMKKNFFMSSFTIIFTVFMAIAVNAQDARAYAKAFNAGTPDFTYIRDTKHSVLVVENTHDSRPIMCTYKIQNKEFGWTKDILSKTGRTEIIYPGEAFTVYEGSKYKFIYVKKTWFQYE